MIPIILDFTVSDVLNLTTTFLVSYLFGSIPFAYLIVKMVNGENITTHGSGNVGAMNVRRTTDSWGWFTVAMVADALKGFIPVIAAFFLAGWNVGPSDLMARLTIEGLSEFDVTRIAMQAGVFGAVMGHNYSLFMAFFRQRFARTGKGLATGAGALLAYDWRYFIAVVVIGLATIAITRYMMAGQVAGAATLPSAALVLGSPDWPFALGMGLLVYVAHHKRFIGMLRGREPKFYVNDSMGPRG